MPLSAGGKFYKRNGLFSVEVLANHQDFPNVIPAEKELARGKVLEQVFDVPIIEDPLQLKPLNRLKFEGIFLNDVVAGIEGFRAGVLGMKEGQQVALGLQHGLQTLNQGLYQAFRKIVSHVPEQDGIE